MRRHCRWSGYSVFFTLLSDASARDLYYTHTSDPTLINLSIKDSDRPIHFNIPRNYLTFSPNLKAGDQQIIVIQTTFPKAGPIASLSHQNDPSAVTVRLLSHAPTGGHHKTSTTLAFFLERELTRVDDVPSFDVYVATRDLKKYKDKARIIEIWFVPTGRKDIYFTCGRARKGLRRCTGHADYGQDLDFRFNFDAGKLQQWSDVHAFASRLIDSFRVETSEKR